MQHGAITTNDGVNLHYVEAGSGPDLLLVSGWTLTVEVWEQQIEEFSKTHHVIAYDHRGHGKSDHPSYGYRISRLAADAHQVIESLDLSDVTWVAHSMGCGVAWAYWDLYRDQHLRRFVLIDQPPVLASFPDWPDDLAGQFGVPHKAENVPDFVAALRSPKGEEVAAGAVEGMFTSSMPQDQKAVVLQQMLLTSRAAASALMFSQIGLDWRDILAEITIPTLLIGGEASLFSAGHVDTLRMAIPNSKAHVISAGDGGSHMMIMESASAVNNVIRSFIESEN
jgi:non-heme chloroperoxidase